MPDAPYPYQSLTADLVIVGAGTSGLFAAYYAGFRGLKVVVLDSLPEVGGQVTAMYPEKKIYDVAGFPGVTGRDLVSRLVEQAAPSSPRYVLGERVQTIDQVTGSDGTALVIETDHGTRISAKAAVVAGGIGAFSPRPMPAAPGVTSADVTYFVQRIEEFTNLDVVVIGGGDSAFDWAVALSYFTQSVTLIHRRSTFRAHAYSVAEAHKRGIRVLTDSVVSAGSRGTALEALHVTVSGGASPITIPCDRIIAALGFTAQLGPILEWGLGVVGRRHIPVDSAMRTAIPRVFASGDITTYDGKVPLIAVGFGEAATAVNNACHALEPEADVFPGHSTDRSPQLVGS